MDTIYQEALEQLLSDLRTGKTLHAALSNILADFNTQGYRQGFEAGKQETMEASSAYRAGLAAGREKGVEEFRAELLKALGVTK